MAQYILTIGFGKHQMTFDSKSRAIFNMPIALGWIDAMQKMCGRKAGFDSVMRLTTKGGRVIFDSNMMGEDSEDRKVVARWSDAIQKGGKDYADHLALTNPILRVLTA